MSASCMRCKRSFLAEETATYTCADCKIDIENDRQTVMNGVISTARFVLIWWHAGKMSACDADTQDALNDLDEAMAAWRSFMYPDLPCEVCQGTRGGVPGNENIVNGRIICDYCHVDELQKAEKVVEAASETYRVNPVLAAVVQEFEASTREIIEGTQNFLGEEPEVTSQEEPWHFDGDCTRCNTTMNWEGDEPKTPEDALCHGCVRAERDAMKDALRAFEGRWGSMCRGTEQYDALLVAAGIEPFDVDRPDVDMNPTPINVSPGDVEIREGIYWYKGRVVHKAIISAVKDHANYHGVSEQYTPIMPKFKGWE